LPVEDLLTSIPNNQSIKIENAVALYALVLGLDGVSILDGTTVCFFLSFLSLKSLQIPWMKLCLPDSRPYYIVFLSFVMCHLIQQASKNN